MVHLHGLSHLARRQRNRQQKEEEEDEVTVVVTMSNTFTGDVVWVTQTAGSPVQQTRVSSDSKPTTTAVSSKKASTTAKETSSGEKAKTTSSHDSSSSLITATSSASASTSASDLSTQAAVATTASSLAAGLASTSPSPSAEASSGGGMSGGAKAGLALGILLAIAAILGAVLFVCRRKKQNAAQQKVDDEKASMRSAPPPPPPQVEAAPSIQSPRSMSAAPRLSLRPVTQFDPAFPNHKNNGNVLAMAATGPSAAGALSPDEAKSSWERLGASNAAAAPANPFNDPQPRSISPQDPFSNNAAIEPSNSAPTTPTNVSQSAVPGAEFANPALAIAAADATVLQTPSTVRSATDSMPSSPAWTEDIPASPGPAPSGPLPVAASGRASNGPNSAPNNVHRIQLDFKPSMSDELELRAGQLVRMLHEYDDGWALCVRMDRSQQGVVPRTCLSKNPVKPRNGPPRQGPPGPRTRSPPVNHPGAAQPRPLSPATGPNSPHPPSLSPANGRMSPGPRSMSPGPHHMSPAQGRARSNSNAPYSGPPRSMSPGPYGGGPQMAPPQVARPRSNSASQAAARRAPPSGLSPMNPNANTPMPSRKPLPGQAI